MSQIDINLNTLVDPPHTDSISGRGFGEEYAKTIELLQKIESNNKINFIIDSQYVKAINDSFIKGLFSKIFQKYKTIEEVKKHIQITGSDYFKRLFEKNWLILQEIYNV